MNLKHIIFILNFLIAASACTKKEVDAVSFNATTDSVSYFVGDTVSFNLSGNADYIVFYSGENTHQYQYRNRTTATGGKPILNFMSYEQYGTHNQTLSLLLSKDFKGIYDSTTVQNANWVDISNTATFSTGQNNTPSGNINLSDFASKDTPVYIAFKYVDPYDGVSAHRTWTITNLSLVQLLPDSTKTTLLDIPNSIWLSVNLLNTTTSWSVSTTYLKVGGGPAANPSNIVYLISQPINLTGVMPDVGIPIKSITENVPKTFKYVFTKPGTYTITFDARNANISSSSKTIKSVILTIK